MAIQYTTPIEQFVIEDTDLTGCRVWVSYQQGKRELDVEATSITFDESDSTIAVQLTQEQSAMFRAGKVKIQVNWITFDGYRGATEIKDVEWLPNLLEHEVSYD